MSAPKRIKMSKSTDDNTIARSFQKFEHKEHILKRPGTYVGSVEEASDKQWIVDEKSIESKANPQFKTETLTIVPGLLKILDELFLNALDHYVRSTMDSEMRSVASICVQVDRTSGEISIRNDGDGVPILMHPDHGVYTVELIFGQLLTSTNYDDSVKRVVGGLNGYGAKLANVFSKYFKIETVDAKRKLLYTQCFESNMSVTHPPVLQANYKKAPYTKITLLPDYARFGLPRLDKDHCLAFQRRAYELAACALPRHKLSLTYNDQVVSYPKFETFARGHIKSDAPLVCERYSERWDVCIALSDSFQQVSFVNGIRTSKGGRHVDYVVNVFTKKFVEYIKRKNKYVVKPQHVKEHIHVFVRCLITNPSFDSQTKDCLTTPVSSFGSELVVSDKFIDTIAKYGLVDRVLETYKFKEARSRQRVETKRGSKIIVDKLDDANFAGTDKAKECVLIVTEGDSAKSMAVAGLSVVGRDYVGVWPVQGKIINAYKKDTQEGFKQLVNNKEIVNFQKILGLQIGKPAKVSELRYGSVKVMADQDTDGFHIQGLLMNMIRVLWPELIACDGFITSMSTPIIKVSKKSESVSFYMLSEYEAWKVRMGDTAKGWSIKYYKGLGTSTAAEARDYFKENRYTKYVWTGDETSGKALELAFHPKLSATRKTWLGAFDPDRDVLDESIREVPYEEFINKKLIHFSNADNTRSIPSVVDGLKPSQRKVLYAAFKRNLVRKEIKVAQFAGYVSEHSAYHHGEQSLNATIVGMAQDFVGSNNINYLLPNGQFGTRLEGGHDAASPRYICTLLNPLTSLLFPSMDFKLLRYLEDDGFKIEPTYYVPIIPTALVNGFIGVGTGYSTYAPSYNPLEVVRLVRERIRGDQAFASRSLVPYARGFKGRVCMHEDGMHYEVIGNYEVTGYKTLRVTELPVGIWTEKYKSILESWLIARDEAQRGTSRSSKTGSRTKTNSNSTSNESFLVNFTTQCTESKVSFELTIDQTVLRDWVRHMRANPSEFPTIVHQKLKLVKRESMTNIVMFDSHGRIKKYASPVEVVDEHFKVRRELYIERKSFMLEELERKLKTLENKVRFVKSVISTEIDVRSMKRDVLSSRLVELDYDPNPMRVDECEDTEPRDESVDTTKDYAYLTSMPIYSMTLDHVVELERHMSDAKSDRDRLRDTTIESMWEDELEKFEDAFTKTLESDS